MVERSKAKFFAFIFTRAPLSSVGTTVGDPGAVVGVPVVSPPAVVGVVMIVVGMLAVPVGTKVPVAGMVVAGSVTCPPGCEVQPAMSRAILVRQSRKIMSCLLCMEGNRILLVHEGYYRE
jgi:hypothetical protein